MTQIPRGYVSSMPRYAKNPKGLGPGRHRPLLQVRTWGHNPKSYEKSTPLIEVSDLDTSKPIKHMITHVRFVRSTGKNIISSCLFGKFHHLWVSPQKVLSNKNIKNGFKGPQIQQRLMVNTTNPLNFLWVCLKIVDTPKQFLYIYIYI